jgi:hypothetical protein
MAKVRVTIKVKPPWWAGIYILSCKLFAEAFGMTPDKDKICKRIMRHARVING